MQDEVKNCRTYTRLVARNGKFRYATVGQMVALG
jgi:hypothetical protein